MPQPNRPPPLRPGAPIAVLGPASPPRSLRRYRDGLSRLNQTYDVRFAWSPGRERGYLASPDRDRASALHEAIQTPDLRALFCVRGGYGSLRLLDRLDWGLARQYPTLLVGYSDITALHLALYARAGWTGLSGPVVTEWAVADNETLEPFQALAAGATGPLASTLSALTLGAATGPLLGGNLSVLTRLLGTPYAPSFDGAILCLEDVGEAPYEVDRMLGHLQHAGVLQDVAGIVLGQFRTDDDGGIQPSLSLETVFQHYLAHRPYPVATCLAYGHHLPRTTLPIGCRVSLSVESDTADLSVLTPVTSRS